MFSLDKSFPLHKIKEEKKKKLWEFSSCASGTRMGSWKLRKCFIFVSRLAIRSLSKSASGHKIHFHNAQPMKKQLKKEKKKHENWISFVEYIYIYTNSFVWETITIVKNAYWFPYPAARELHLAEMNNFLVSNSFFGRITNTQNSYHELIYDFLLWFFSIFLLFLFFSLVPDRTTFFTWNRDSILK